MPEPRISPIVAFVGPNGSGKSLAAMEYVVRPALDRGRVVLSNTKIFASPDDAHLDPDDRELHSQYVPLKSWRQLNVAMFGTVVFLDEISAMFDSRESSRMPVQLINRLQQLRKGDNRVVWTGPDWDRCDKSLRRVTRQVVLCRGYLPEEVEGREWGANRLFRYRFYDRSKFEEFSESSALADRKGTIRPQDARWRRRSQLSTSMRMYDTYGEVDLLDHLDEYGTCVDCGGTRRRPKCSCVHPARTEERAMERALEEAHP